MSNRYELNLNLGIATIDDTETGNSWSNVNMYDFENLCWLLNDQNRQIVDLEAKQESARAVIDANFRIAEERDKFKARVQKLEEERREVSKEIEKYQQLSPDKTDWMAEYHVLTETIKELSYENIGLEKQLVNKDKQIDKLKSENHALMSDNAYQEADIFELKQQLTEKETRIAELEDKDWYEGTIKQLEEQNERLINQLAEKEKEIEERMMSFEKRCQEYYKSKEFTIEKLEKVKEWCEKHKDSDEYDYMIAYEPDEEDSSGCVDYLKDQIDNQIKQLKEWKWYE